MGEPGPSRVAVDIESSIRIEVENDLTLKEARILGLW